MNDQVSVAPALEPLIDVPRVAVVFKTYSWDSYIERRAAACEEAAGAADFFVSVDETNGAIGPIPFARVVPTSNAELIASGLPNRFEAGSLIWWNADYVHYQFRAAQPDYDYYIFVEYDAVTQGGLEPLVRGAAATSTDFVALPIRIPTRDWFWTLFHQQTYSVAELQGSLNCITLFSARALDHLARRRREMGCRYWPSSEAFLLTEVLKAGLRFRSLEEFGDATRYDWFPPILEQDLPDDAAVPAFFHPVLDRRRYIASTLKSTKSLRSFVSPRSTMRRSLARFPREEYMPLLVTAARDRLKLNLTERLKRARARLAHYSRATAHF